MLDWMLMPYKRYADFSGRSRRKEFWLFQLFVFIVYGQVAIKPHNLTQTMVGASISTPFSSKVLFSASSDLKRPFSSKSPYGILMRPGIWPRCRPGRGSGAWA